MKTFKVLLIAPPGRKRDSLSIMFESLNKFIHLQIVASLQDAASFVPSLQPAVIFVDLQNLFGKLNSEIELIQAAFPKSQLVLLQGSLISKGGHRCGQIYEIVYDDLTISGLTLFFETLIQSEPLSQTN